MNPTGRFLAMPGAKGNLPKKCILPFDKPTRSGH
jgi:hypothetical protein